MGEPHVLILPLPAQGHIKPMLSLAELLSYSGIKVTFINTDHNHDRLLKNIDTTSFNNRHPKFVFRSLPDGLSHDSPPSFSQFKEFLEKREIVFKPAFRELLLSTELETSPTCIISDGVMSSVAMDVAEELQIPIITFRTYSATCFWTQLHISKLIEQGEVPFPDQNMDKPITCIPGLENLLRRRDLHTACRVEKVDDPFLQFYVNEALAMTRASGGLILNACNEIEAPVVARFGQIFNKVYTIGPVHALLKSRIKHSVSSNGVLWKEDTSCMAWLDSQPSRSVLYVSFGSVVKLTREQMLEIWQGIVNSGKRFLWVTRANSIVEEEASSGQIPIELEIMDSIERGCIVSWAPQEEVLAHPAVGGFFTHSGWNSSFESMWAGVPMICLPQIADQHVNSRCVSELWKTGFDMKDTCDRLTVENLVRDLMDIKKDEIMESTDKIARLVRDSVKEGGSTFINLEILIQDIISMPQ